METTEKDGIAEVSSAAPTPGVMRIGLDIPLSAAKCLCPEELDLKGERVGDGTAATCEKCANELVKIVQTLLVGFENALGQTLRRREGDIPRIIPASTLRNLKS